MKIDRISYKQKFPTFQFLNMDVGFEASVEPGADVLKELKLLKETAELFHRQEFPHFYTENGKPITIEPVQEEPVIGKRTREQEIEAHLTTINECRTLRNLEMFANLVQRENVDVLYEAYNNKKKELQ